MSNNVELAVRMTADADDAVRAANDVGDAFDRMASDVSDASRKADDATSRMDSVAESADTMASKSSQAAGGLGDLGGALSQVPGPLGAVGSGMELLAPSIMGVTGAADLLNLVTESNIVLQARQKAAAISSAVTSKAVAVATRTWAIAQRVLNAAMRANPIGLVITAITIVVGLLVLAYKRSDTFRRIVQTAMRAAAAAVRAVWDVLKSVASFVAGKATAVWRVLERAASAAWNGIRNVVSGVVSRVVSLVGNIRDRAAAVWTALRTAAASAFDAVRSKVADVVSAVVGKAQSIRDKFADVWSGVKSAATNALNALTAPIQWIVDKVQWILDKVSSIHIPHIPGLGRVAVAPTGPASYTAPAASSGAPYSSVNISVSVQGGATSAQADEFMRAVDSRLRMLGKAPVFS